MALEEHDRENLLRDGRMMPLRGESLIGDVTVVVGFRGQGQLSLYCGPDPVFQFNASRRLRRVYFQGRRFAAENGRLVELTRNHRGGNVQNVSLQVDPATQTIMLSSLNDWLQRIRDAVQPEMAPWRVVDDKANMFRDRLLQWLEQIPVEPEIANAPNA